MTQRLLKGNEIRKGTEKVKFKFEYQMRTRKEIEELEEATLAPFAMKSKDSLGREHEEPPHQFRTCYQRDRDRVVHCEAFRKLEYKTQVFVIFEGDYYRTRLTHTLEVAQIARTIGRNLRLNEDLVEAIALAHDLGHPPFGHAGEEALDNIMKDANLGSFNHNKRGYEIVTRFEKRYPDFDGLNLTAEVLVGILKHKTMFDNPVELKRRLQQGSTLEAQVVDFADSLAYLNHDIDDGLTSGCITEQDLMESELWQNALKNVKSSFTFNDREMLKYQIVKELLDKQIKDLLMTTNENFKKLDFGSSQEVKDYKQTVVGFSQLMTKQRDHLQNLLNEKLYHHYRVVRMTSKAKRIIQDLFEVYLKEPNQLPYAVYQRDKTYTKQKKYETICNYLASMTDRFALDEHMRLFNPYTKV